MPQPANQASAALEQELETQEERAFRSRFDDGVGDLLIGFVILIMGASVGTEWGGLMGVWGALVVPLWVPLHRAVSNPRLGHVEFGPGRRAKVRKKKIWLSLGLGVTFLGGIAVFMLSTDDPAAAADNASRPWAGLPFLGALALLLTVVGALIQTNRAYLYAGLLMGFGFTTREATGIDPLGLALLLSGACITLSGLSLLVRFLRAHPRLEDPELNGHA